MITKVDIENEKARSIKKSTLKYIVEWYKLSRPSLRWWITSFIAYLMYVGFFLLFAVFSAKVIDCLYLEDWTGAYIWLAIELLTIILRNVALEVEYRAYANTWSSVYCNVQRKVYRKMLSFDKKSLKTMPKEQIILTVGDNLANICEYEDNLVLAVGKFIIGLVSFITIMCINVFAGLLILALSIFDYLILNLVNKKIGKAKRKMYNSKEAIYENITKVYNGTKVITEFNQDDVFERDYINKSAKYCKDRKHYYKLYSFKTNGFFAIWKTIVYGIAFILIFLISDNKLDIPMYLVIVSYLSTCTENFNSLFNIAENTENMKIAVDRVNSILNLSEKELKTFGKIKKNKLDSTLDFIHINYDDKKNREFGKLEDVTFSIKKNDLNIIYGDKFCGKRVIFDLLRRKILPDSGKILLDGIELAQFDDKYFKSYIYYVAGSPLFLNSSIWENLSVVTKDKNKIISACEYTGFYDFVLSKKEGFDFIINEKFTGYYAFLLGLTRSLLTDCKILMIYELPKGVTVSEKNKIIKILKKLKEDRTIIIFTFNDSLKDIAGAVNQISKGKLVSSSYEKDELVDTSKLLHTVKGDLRTN